MVNVRMAIDSHDDTPAYQCVECGEPTSKGSLVVFAGGEAVVVALCPTHMVNLRRAMLAQGVRVEQSDRLN